MFYLHKKGATMLKKDKTRWGFTHLSTHRRKKLLNAIKRRDNDYLLERQRKYSRVFPNTLGAIAKFTFLDIVQDEEAYQ